MDRFLRIPHAVLIATVFAAAGWTASKAPVPSLNTAQNTTLAQTDGSALKCSPGVTNKNEIYFVGCGSFF